MRFWNVLSTYFRAVPLALRHPSVFVMPLLAAVVDLLLSQIAPLFTGPVGGFGGGIFQMIAQLVYLWAFGIAIVQANDIWRGHRGDFDSAWENGRRKTGDLVFAAIGFQFIVYAAQYVGSFLLPTVGLVLGVIAAFFLIYTIPAAAIGGMPGSAALSASVRAVGARPLSSVLLAVVFFAIWFVLVPGVLPYALTGLSPLLWNLVTAAIRAIVLGYLAFPFAKQYDDIAFTRSW